MNKKIILAIKDPFYALKVVLGRISPLIKNDDKYLKMTYYLSMHRRLNLSSPQTYNEKLQWLKIHDRHDEYTKMVDKADAKEVASKLLGEEYIVPTYGVWDRFDDIDFDMLPNQFVLKCTHNSGGTVVCRDKRTFDKEKASKILNHCLCKNPFWATREYPYKNVKPRIIAEQFMSDGRTEQTGLTDFKFFCFNGEVKFLYVSQGLENHETAGISFFDLDGNRLQFKRSDFRPIEHFEKPKRFEEMKILANKAAREINAPFVRIDLYEVYGKIYFSEFTFFPCSGVLPFDPIECDYKIGQLLKLPKI
jgi:hypothetical protein